MDNLINSLTKLVLLYANFQKLPDEKFIDEASYIIVKYLKLDKYVNNVIIIDNNNIVFDNNMLLGKFFPRKHMVGINLNIILQRYNLNADLDLYNTSLFKCLFVLSTILHELSHAFQIKELDNCSDTLYKKVLYPGMYFLGYSNDEPCSFNFNRAAVKIYRTSNYYKCVPYERLANIMSDYIIKNIIHNISSIDKNITDYYKNNLLHHLFNAYNIYNGPTIFANQIIMNNIDNFNISCDSYVVDSINNLDIPKHMSMIQKLYYGLPVNYFTRQKMIITDRQLQRKIKLK